MDRTAPSSLSTTVPRSPSVATKTPPNVCLQSSLLAFSSVTLAASAAHLHHSLVSLLNCSLHLLLPHPVLNSKKMSRVPLYLIMHFPRNSTQNHSTGYISLLLMALAIHSCSSFFPVLETFLRLLFHPNRSSPLPAPTGSPPPLVTVE